MSIARQGVFTTRLTVSDAASSATAETTATIRTLTGKWQEVADGVRIIVLTQAGTTVTGTYERGLVASPDLPQPVPCPFAGSVGPSSPRVSMQQPQCQLTPTRIAIAQSNFLDPSPDINTLTGIEVQGGGQFSASLDAAIVWRTVAARIRRSSQVP